MEGPDRLALPSDDIASQPRAVVLLSGGLDSATVLAIARERGFACHCLCFDYGQRHRHELPAAKAVAEALGAAELRVLSIDLRAIGGSALTADIAVPKDRDDTVLNNNSAIPITYVPARNLVFLSLAVGYAEVLGAVDLFIGVNALDYSGYPDCRPEFINAFARTAALATRAGVEDKQAHADGADHFRIHAPLIDMTKAQIIEAGTRLGVDYALTHSCYDPDERGLACGRCDSCVLRRRGFREARIPDPTRYAAPIG
ncbi:MAG: 7-cyano-7-deazaguanine synthase QueC [Phycisphaerales bacterium]